MELRTLGDTGIEVSRLCFGTGTQGWSGASDQTRLGLQELADLMHYAFDRGITFFDVADQYGSHEHIARMLKAVDRDDVVLTTKTCAKTAAEAEADIERFQKELGTEVLDIVLMHCMTSADWTDARSGVLEVLEQKKQEGVILAHGVSCHDFGAFCTAAETDWVDVVLARINYAGKHMDGPPEKIIPVIDKMHDAGMGVYGMKVVGAGELGDDARDAIHYVLDLPSIDAITIGMINRQQVDDNIGHVGVHRLEPQPG